jgi:hypothetical protein
MVSPIGREMDGVGDSGRVSTIRGKTDSYGERTPVGNKGDSGMASTIGRGMNSYGRALVGPPGDNTPVTDVGDSWMVSSTGRKMDSCEKRTPVGHVGDSWMISTIRGNMVVLIRVNKGVIDADSIWP